MIEFLFELLVELFFDVAVPWLLEVLVEFGFESMENLFLPQRAARRVYAACGVVILGGVLGLILALVFPHRLLPTPRIPGLSLVLAPLAVGLLMGIFGNWRRNHGGHPTFLATFWGGALFAFILALVRWLMVARP